jgi:hypothetical protein
LLTHAVFLKTLSSPFHIITHTSRVPFDATHTHTHTHNTHKEAYYIGIHGGDRDRRRDARVVARAPRRRPPRRLRAHDGLLALWAPVAGGGSDGAKRRGGGRGLHSPLGYKEYASCRQLVFVPMRPTRVVASLPGVRLVTRHGTIPAATILFGRVLTHNVTG